MYTLSFVPSYQWPKTINTFVLIRDFLSLHFFSILVTKKTLAYTLVLDAVNTALTSYFEVNFWKVKEECDERF